MGLAYPQVPVLFFRPPTTLANPNSAISIPKCAQNEEMDYEVELAIVLGRSTKNVSEDEAMEFVLGYTVANDLTARKHQATSSQWGYAKGESTPTQWRLFTFKKEAVGCVRRKREMLISRFRQLLPSRTGHFEQECGERAECLCVADEGERGVDAGWFGEKNDLLHSKVSHLPLLPHPLSLAREEVDSRMNGG